MRAAKTAIIIGAGAGGLAAAMDLSAAGLDVTVVEKEPDVGGKMRHLTVDGVPIDGGPTVFTMRWIFEALFERSGKDIAREIDIRPAKRLARHAWLDGSRLDLWADIDQSADAIASFANAKNAKGYKRFCRDSQSVFETLRETFIAAQKPNPLSLSSRIGFHRFNRLWQTRPFQTYWAKLESYFEDPRLRQLFGRYGTYIGSSPFLTPATLMLIAHVEQDGVWLVEGGMHAVAKAMRRAAEDNGATFRFGSRVSSLKVSGGRTAGVTLETGEELIADVVVFNGDQSALSEGLLGLGTKSAGQSVPPKSKSLSAIVSCTHTRTSGFDLDYHTVFFSDAYKREFDQVFEQRHPPTEPTIYICAQDRAGDQTPTGRERLLILVNAPADGDQPDANMDWPDSRTRDALARYGLTLEPDAPTQVTDPKGFAALFPGSGGALYGAANHSPFATFARNGAKSRIEGLYFAGGTVHPGAGVPMATMSGQLAAQAILAR
ncbi:MAG: 1-hydroxycarotenoid 3,4-desaturase CrtD [Pseudomonadota bacterium]